MLRLLRSRWTIAVLIVVALGTVAALTIPRKAAADEANLSAKVTRGDFNVVVTTAGELRAKSAIEIRPPQNADRAGAYQMKISTIIPEGTIVKEGDTVAVLDRSPLTTSMQTFNLQMQKAQAVFEQAQLDTTLNLSKAREDLRLGQGALEEKKIAKEQSIYEAPSIQRQAEIDYQKAERAYTQGKTDYTTRDNQAKAKMREVSADVERNRIQLTLIQDVMKAFTITAPSPGMLIYARDYNGKKKAAGAYVYSYDPAVATLPDLTKMESITYVNEVDVRKVAVGQPVKLSLDSDPTKKLSGKVVSVANMGEERPNSDAKVFEVKIEVAEKDTTLRPGMTTGNGIEIQSTKDVLSIPLEAISSEGNVTYVFKKAGGGLIKQEVQTGAMNDTHAVITKGLDENDVVMLVPPIDRTGIESVRLPGSGGPLAPAGGDAPNSKSVPVDTKAKGAPASARDGAPPSKPAPTSAPASAPPAKQNGRQ